MEKEKGGKEEIGISEEKNSETLETKSKSKALLLIPLVLVFILVIGGFFFFKNRKKTISYQQEESFKNENSTQSSSTPFPSYTLEQVAIHNSREDCWLVISDKVYDVTQFVAKHPGKDAILEGCGKDATELFQTRPMGSKTPHSEKAQEMLSNFFIGDLEK